MRKISTFIFGLVLLSGAFVFQSDAAMTACGTVDGKTYYTSRGCCLDAKRPIRAYSNRIGPYRYRPNTKRCDNCVTRISIAGRKDVTYYKQYRISPISYRRRIQLQRQNDYKHYPRYANTVSSSKNAVRNNDYIVKTGAFTEPNSIVNANDQSSLKSRDYTWAIPAGFTKDSNGIYRSSRSSLAFRVISAGKCSSISFTACVHNVSTNFKETQLLSIMQNYRKVYRWNQVVHTDFSHFPTITESFDATVYGQKNRYFIFNALNPENGDIIRIEMVEDYSKWSSVKTAFGAFETFRLKF